jgi:hypothetical protein
MRQSLLVFGLFFFFLLFSLSFAKAQEYYISDCSVLDQEGATYYLTQDIIDQNVSACINIIANNITLDCQNNLIDGVDFYVPQPDEQMSFGIISNGYSNIVIRNCRLSDWSHPLNIINGENISVENIEAFSGVWVGPFVENSNNVYFSNITIYDFAQDSFTFRNTINSRLENTMIYNVGHHGITIDGNSNNISLENIEVFNTSDIGININSGSNHVLRNLRVHSTKGISVWGGSNHLLENIETFDTTPDWAGVWINSENTILRNIYSHNEYRSILGGTNNTLEYSRCENVTWGCWHIFADNSVIRHNDFLGLGFFGVNGGEVYNNTIGEFNIRDWENKPSSFIKIYNNTIYSYLFNYFDSYRSESIEIYDNYFYGILGVFDRGGINTSVHNNFFNVSWAIAFYNGATNSHAFSNEIHSTNAFYFSRSENVVINDNIIEANTLAYYNGNAENIISCNNTIIAFNKSWDYNPNYNISLLNVMRIESDSCEPYVNIVSTEPVNFGNVKVGEESNTTVPITIKSNMINVSILVRGDSDFPDFPISSVTFLADKDKPYPVEEIQLERGVTKATSIFLPSLVSTFYSLWKVSVPSGIAAGYKQANATMFALIPQTSDSRQLTLSLNVISEIPPPTPPPRLYQLSPIAGILAYVLLPIVFAMVAQKYLLGEVELSLPGLIKYLLLFIMVIIIAIGFALVFSII